MQKEMRFSKEFCVDLRSLMLECVKNNTDSLALELTIDGYLLDISMTFRPHREEA